MTRKTTKTLFALVAIIVTILTLFAVSATAGTVVNPGGLASGAQSNPKAVNTADGLFEAIDEASKRATDANSIAGVSLYSYHIRLTGDIALPEGKTIKLDNSILNLHIDLNNFSITATGIDSDLITLEKGRLTLDDNSNEKGGAVDVTFKGAAEHSIIKAKSGTTLRINYARLIVNTKSNDAKCIDAMGSVVINDGYFDARGSVCVKIENTTGAINGGHFSGKSTVIELINNSTEIYGGYFAITKYGDKKIIASDKALVIDDGAEIYDSSKGVVTLAPNATSIDSTSTNLICITNSKDFTPKSDDYKGVLNHSGSYDLTVPVGKHTYDIEVAKKWYETANLKINKEIGFKITSGYGYAPITNYVDRNESTPYKETYTFKTTLSFYTREVRVISKFVNYEVLAVPVIKTQPQDAEIAIGGTTVKFSFEKEAENPTYQWHAVNSKGDTIPWSEIEKIMKVSDTTKFAIMLSQCTGHYGEDIYIYCTVTNGGNPLTAVNTEKAKLSTPHKFGSKVKPEALKSEATCTEPALYYSSCECGELNKEEVFAVGFSLGHDKVVIEEEKKATCTESGHSALTQCSRCHEILDKKEIINPVGHSYDNKITPATSAKDGKIERTCESCGYEAESTTVAMIESIKLSSSKVTYNGKKRTPSVIVKDTKGASLKKGTDFDTEYDSGRKDIGEYIIKVTFKGNYEGTKNLVFTILPKAVSKISATQTTSSITVSWSKISGVTGYKLFLYKGSSKITEKALKDEDITDYTFKNLSSGAEYTVKIKVYKKVDGTNYWSSTNEIKTATKTATPKISKVTAGSSQATVLWNNVSGESGYQVYYSTKKDSGYKKGASVKANGKTATIKKLQKGKTYYFKVRAYKKVDGKVIYSAWSTTKSVKIK